MLKKINPTTTKAWQALSNHFNTVKDLHMKDACVENFVKTITSGIDGGGRYASLETNQQSGS